MTPKTISRPVYLPAVPGGWYDFWTGAALAGGQTIDAPAPYETIPVHVRAGSIVPFGPELQYSSEKPADPLTVWVYAGADGEYSLYEDDGASYGYERGEFTRISFRWDDAQRTLTIVVQPNTATRGSTLTNNVSVATSTTETDAGNNSASATYRLELRSNTGAYPMLMQLISVDGISAYLPPGTSTV